MREGIPDWARVTDAQVRAIAPDRPDAIAVIEAAIARVTEAQGAGTLRAGPRGLFLTLIRRKDFADESLVAHRRAEAERREQAEKLAAAAAAKAERERRDIEMREQAERERAAIRARLTRLSDDELGEVIRRAVALAPEFAAHRAAEKARQNVEPQIETAMRYLWRECAHVIDDWDVSKMRDEARGGAA